MSRVLYYPIMNKKEVKMKKEEFILEGKPEQKLEIVCLICFSLLIMPIFVYLWKMFENKST